MTDKFFDRLKKEINEICSRADEQYDEVCKVMREDISQYESIFSDLEKQERGG